MYAKQLNCWHPTLSDSVYQISEILSVTWRSFLDTLHHYTTWGLDDSVAIFHGRERYSGGNRIGWRNILHNIEYQPQHRSWVLATQASDKTSMNISKSSDICINIARKLVHLTWKNEPTIPIYFPALLKIAFLSQHIYFIVCGNTLIFTWKYLQTPKYLA